MANKPTLIEVPGEPAAPDQETNDPSTAADPPAADLPAPDAPQAPATPEQAKEQLLAQQVEATKGLVGSDKALDWSHLTMPAALAAKVNPNATDESLPRSEDIDASKIPYGRSVLTREGWLMSSQPDPRVRGV
jgi:hypothetical protein